MAPSTRGPAEVFAAEVTRFRSMVRRTASATAVERRQLAEELRALADGVEDQP